MHKYNINAILVPIIKQLYDKDASAVQGNSSTGEWFITVGVKQGCLLSPTLFNIFLAHVMNDALETDEKVSIGGRNITNLQFADDIDAVVEEEKKLEALMAALMAPKEDQCKRTDAWYCNFKYLNSCQRLWLKTEDSLKNCTSHCSFYKAEANLDR